MTLKLNGSSSGYTALDAPAAAGSNTLTLPANNGSANQYLKNSGTAGVLEFAALSAGKILQVVSATDAHKTVSNNTAVDIYDSNVAITLASTSNKVFCLHVTAYAHQSAGSDQDIESTYVMNRTTSGDTVGNLNTGRLRIQSATDINSSIVLCALDTTFSNLANNYNVTIAYGSGNESANAYNNTIVLVEVAA